MCGYISHLDTCWACKMMQEAMFHCVKLVPKLILINPNNFCLNVSLSHFRKMLIFQIILTLAKRNIGIDFKVLLYMDGGAWDIILFWEKSEQKSDIKDSTFWKEHYRTQRTTPGTREHTDVTPLFYTWKAFHDLSFLQHCCLPWLLPFNPAFTFLKFLQADVVKSFQAKTEYFTILKYVP